MKYNQTNNGRCCCSLVASNSHDREVHDRFQLTFSPFNHPPIEEASGEIEFKENYNYYIRSFSNENFFIIVSRSPKKRSLFNVISPVFQTMHQAQNAKDWNGLKGESGIFVQ